MVVLTLVLAAGMMPTMMVVIDVRSGSIGADSSDDDYACCVGVVVVVVVAVEVEN